MRCVVAALSALMLLAGCADKVAYEKSGTILQYPSRNLEAATKQANEQCAAYHQTAKLQQPADDHANAAVVTFACE